MPELPEVETTKLGIKIHLEGQTICAVRVRQAQFRIPVPNAIEALNLAGRNSAFCPQCQPMPAIQKL